MQLSFSSVKQIVLLKVPITFKVSAFSSSATMEVQTTICLQKVYWLAGFQHFILWFLNFQLESQFLFLLTSWNLSSSSSGELWCWKRRFRNKMSQTFLFPSIIMLYDKEPKWSMRRKIKIQKFWSDLSYLCGYSFCSFVVKKLSYILRWWWLK